MAKYTQDQLVKKQIQLEFMMRSVGIERFHRNDERSVENSASQTSYNSAIINGTVEQLADTIDAYYEAYEGKRGKRPTLFAYLQQVPSKVAALIAIRTVIDLMGAKDMHVSNMLVRVGNRIEDQVRFAGLEDFAPKYMERIKENLAKKGSKSYAHKQQVFNAAIRNSGYEHQDWPKEVVSQIGAFLIDLVGNVDFNGAPLLTKETIDTGVGKANTEVRLVPSDHVCEWIEQFKQKNEVMSPSYAPCVIPPRDWTSPFDGGFHVPEIAKTMSLVRGKKKHIAGLTYEQMPIVYEAVNGLQRVAWAISKPVLDVLQGVMECGLPLGIPPQEAYPIRPAPIPAGMEKLSGKALVAELTSEERDAFFAWKQDAADVNTQNKLRVNELTQIGRVLAEAKRYSAYDMFWFVYSLDYRSRVYVESSLITPQGGDIQKGLLKFAEGKKLGFYGAYWLAVQGAGVWAKKDEKGVALDKKPFPERVRAIMNPEFTEMVRSIVEDPLNCTDWCNADKPWQFLNWCFEWSTFVDWCEAGNDHKEFVSYLPIAMDGSCSGTQHYSMMLKDEVSGSMVNLLPCDAPNDIYGSTAGIFKRKLENILADHETVMATRLMASEWCLHANRNLCKPPVMTLVYGSSQMTCRKTSLEYLQGLQAKEDAQARAAGRQSVKKYNFESESDALSFAVPLIWEAVGETQQSAKRGMAYIKKVSRFCSNHGIPMRWPTPTGFIVTQEIFKTQAKRVNTALFGGTKISLREETNELDANKMSSSSAPNFIHSMDASHLILVTYAMLAGKTPIWERVPVTGEWIVTGYRGKSVTDSLAVIHDSFGAHACHTNKLRRTLLQELVRMYEQNDVLEDLVSTAEDTLMQDAKLAKPELGNMNYDDVLKAKYAFG